MAEALSLAVNIFTILEFGRKFSVLAFEIHKHGNDAVPRIESIDLTSTDLARIAGELSQQRPSPATGSLYQNDEQIHQLALRCVKAARKMQETISVLNGNKGRAVVKAFKYKWKESDIVEFQAEIEDLRSELMLNLIVWLRTGMKQSLDNQYKIIEEFSDFRSQGAYLKESLTVLGLQQKGFSQQIFEILSSNANSVIGSNRPEALLETDLMKLAQDSAQQIEDGDVAGLQLSSSRLARVEIEFLNIFQYDGMFDREAGVSEAHPDTLKWIFEDPGSETGKWDNFGQWLESEDQLYWITGKMGSGKSTLMKYVSERVSGRSVAPKKPVLYVPEELTGTSTTRAERRCTPYLLRWAQGQPVFVATFYFWAGSSAETRIQTSVEGLYRTLLTQMLEAYPDSAPFISPRRWENLCLFNRDGRRPNITELKDILARAIQYVSSKAKICLFIDGLDEFEGKNEDLKGLIAWVKSLVETSTVKLCVASRPWQVFENALQDQPHLLMEDFNFKDIQQYVWRNFHDDPNFRDRNLVDAAFCNQILNDIVTKAEGVFLWVDLVCTHLLEAMSRGDLISDLRKIVNALPVDMENLYGHILANLDARDTDQAAKYFLLLQECLGWPGALIFSFADEIDKDSEYSLKMSEEPLTATQFRHRVSELRKRINSRCRGLLSVSTESFHFGQVEFEVERKRGAVQYCHRSARDYLTMSSIQVKLNNMLDGAFDPHLRLCSANLAWWKCAADYASMAAHTRPTSLYNCVQHAAKVTSESCNMMVRLLDELNPDFDNSDYMIDGYFSPCFWFGGSMLSFAVVLGVKDYVRSKVGQSQDCVVRSSSVHISKSQNARGWSTAGMHCLDEILDAHTDGNMEWPLLLDTFLSAIKPNPDMVSLLLENGADPNIRIRSQDGKRVMTGFDVVVSLLKFHHEHPDLQKEWWVDSLCLLLRYGAKPRRTDVGFLRDLIGEDTIHNLKLPHMGRHRVFISKHVARWRKSLEH